MRNGINAALILIGSLSTAFATPAEHCDPNHPDYELMEGYAPIEAIERSYPIYPFTAMNQRKEGTITVSFDVPPNGRPANIEILHAEPYWGFRRAARDAARNWRFEPHRIEGEATICGGARLNFDFRLGLGFDE